MDGHSTLARLRRPEYTGDRRCWQCTVLNVAILAVVAGLLALAGTPVVAVGIVFVGGGAIWLRGYLVPGTPAFAPWLVAAIPGAERLFRKKTPGESPVPDRAEGGSLGETGAPDAEKLLGVLIEAGVVVPDGEELVLDRSFEKEWDETIASLSSLSTETLAEKVREVSAVSQTRAVRDEDTGEEWVALSEGEDIVGEVWLSRPVGIAETAAARLLSEYVDDVAVRRAAAGSLRMFLVECPDCGTELEDATAVSCCGGYNGDQEVPEETLVCPACEVRLFTFASTPRR